MQKVSSLSNYLRLADRVGSMIDQVGVDLLFRLSYRKFVALLAFLLLEHFLFSNGPIKSKHLVK